MSGGSRFLRDNPFLVAAVALPLVVVGFFLLASAVPRWRVPPPKYDLLLAAGRPYHQGPRVSVEFHVNNGRVEATVRPLPANAYPQLSTLWLFDHTTLSVREIPVDLPEDLVEGDPPRTIAIDAFERRRIVTVGKAPDGYELNTQSYRGSGIVGDLFGMRSYEQEVALTNRGRIVPIAFPAPYEYRTPIYAIGWLVDEGPD